MKKQKNDNLKRLYNLDVCRTLAILSIALNHALNSFTGIGKYEDYLTFNYFEKIFITIGYILSLIGVPLFLCLTGALILSKNFETSEDIKRFYKHNLLTLIISVTIWDIIYYFFSLRLFNAKFSLEYLIKVILFIKPATMGHMWYMPMIIGMYVFLPFISVIVKKFKFKDMMVPIIFTFISVFLLSNIVDILYQFNIDVLGDINTIISTAFTGGVYGMYIIMGYYIYKEEILRKFSTKAIGLWFILSFVVTSLFQTIWYNIFSHYSITYRFFTLLITSLLLFELFVG